ncbi:hypothetical protein, partial [Bernardetia sp.]|uniref:hypothetical protein n=1 Tax=Bernardetia sp. TaxID=1937974 RepID=UPI0025C42343
TDTSLVIVKKFPTPLKDTIFFEEGKYRAVIEYPDTVIYKEVEIPNEITRHDIKIDTVGNYIRKIIQPKYGVRGITGIYLKKIDSDFALAIVDKNLNPNQRNKVVKAFKTIKFKEEN